MRFALAALFLVALLTPFPTVSGAPSEQNPACHFILGFAALREQVGPDVVGDCLDNQRFAPNGNAEQPTTRGLLVWRKADNWTAFTDGATTWLVGPYGLEHRANTERFPWEAPDPPPDAIPAAPPPAAAPVEPPAAGSALDRALQLVLNSTFGDIAVLLRNRGVQLVFGELPPGAAGAWQPLLNRITVASRYQGSPPEAIAAVLIHEGTHAQDHFAGFSFAEGTACYDRELHAFTNQAQFWRALYGPEGKANAVDPLDAQMNVNLRTTTQRPTNFLNDLLAIYRAECGPPGSAIPTPVVPPRPTPAGLPPIAAAPAEIRTLGLLANDLAFDRRSGRLLASVPGLGGAIGNSLTVVDPAAGTIGLSLPIGSEPGQLALSDDGQYLYVGLNGSSAVRRVHLPTNTPDLEFSLAQPSDRNTTPGSYGAVIAWQMAVQPGNPHVLAISRDCGCGSSPHGMGIALFDGGVMRPKLGRGNTFGFSPDGASLYGYVDEDTGYAFTRMAVTPEGLEVRDTGSVIQGFRLRLEADAGRLYSSTGRVIDPETRTVVGTYPGADDPNAHRFGRLLPTVIVRPDSSVNRTFFLIGNRTEAQPGSVTMSILAYDQRTFTLAGRIDVPSVTGRVRSLARWGSDGLALSTSAGQLFLIRSPLIAGQ